MSATARTAVVEPAASGHRFQYAAHVCRAALARGDEVLLLTSTGASSSDQFHNFLGDLPLSVSEPFVSVTPSAAEVAEALVAIHRDQPLRTYVIPEGDQLLKSWWRAAPRELGTRHGGPEGVFLYSRFPSRISWTNRADVVHRSAKTAVAVLARLRGRARRVAYIVGRDDLRRGWLLQRVRDPAICSTNARDRDALRERFALPLDRRLVGILGTVSMRKCPPLVLEAAIEAGPEVDVLVAGVLLDDAASWISQLDPARRRRLHVRSGFLPEDEMDAYVAASDIIAVVHLNRGPSGVMGKAQVAGVPVLSAGSKIRGREMQSARGAVHTSLAAPDLAEGIRALLRRGTAPLPIDPTLPTAEEFGNAVLGLPPAASLVAALRG